MGSAGETRQAQEDDRRSVADVGWSPSLLPRRVASGCRDPEPSSQEGVAMVTEEELRRRSAEEVFEDHLRLADEQRFDAESEPDAA